MLIPNYLIEVSNRSTYAIYVNLIYKNKCSLRRTLHQIKIIIYLPTRILFILPTCYKITDHERLNHNIN